MMGGWEESVLLNTNKFAVVTKEQMSSGRHCSARAPLLSCSLFLCSLLLRHWTCCRITVTKGALNRKPWRFSKTVTSECNSFGSMSHQHFNPSSYRLIYFIFKIQN